MVTINNVVYLNEKELAQRCGFSIHFFRKARYKKRGPIYHVLQNRIFYKIDDVELWFKMNLKEIKC